MTPKQTSLYWREWSAAKKAGGLTDQDRYEIMEQALADSDSPIAQHISSKDLTNSQLDKVLAAFRAISRPTDLNAQLHAQRQPRARLLHGIRTAAASFSSLSSHARGEGQGEEYLNSILLDRFGHTDLDRLSFNELKQLLMTMKTRQHTRSRRAPAPQPEPAADNIPF